MRSSAGTATVSQSPERKPADPPGHARSKAGSPSRPPWPAQRKRRSSVLHRIILAAGLAACLTFASAAHAARMPARCHQASAPRLCAIHFHRDRANLIRRKMSLAPIPYRWMAERHPARRIRILTYWATVHDRTKSRYRVWLASPWAWYRTSGAKCVHSKEGSWTANNGNGYYGGFQYDPPTWSAAGGTRYAPRADLATPTQQVIVTRAKVHNDGWGAWPNTAADCGLL